MKPGFWVLNSDMDPHTNVYMRTYLDADGLEHVYYGPDYNQPRPVAWYFPPVEDSGPEREQNETFGTRLLRFWNSFANCLKS